MRWFDYRDKINNKLKSSNITMDSYPRDYPYKGDIYVLRDKKNEILFQCLSKKTLEKYIINLSKVGNEND